MNRFSRLAASVLLLLAGAGAALPQAAPSPLTGTPGRVIILDASGSMNQSDYRAGRKTRIAVAKELLDRQLAALAERGDTMPTVVYAFGSTTSWAEAKLRYGSPADYPPDGPLCRDNRPLVAAFTTPDALRTQTGALLPGLKAQGMTPIHVSLIAALNLLDREKGGEIILISDEEEPNCLPEGQTLCEALLPALRRIRNVTFSVKVVVYETPGSTLQKDLSDCLVATTVRVPPGTGDPAPAIRKREERAEVEVNVAWSDAVLGGGALAPAGFRFRAYPAAKFAACDGTDVVNEGPLSRFEMDKGDYVFCALHPEGTWETRATISGPIKVVVPVGPGIVDLTIRDTAKRQPLAGKAVIAIERVEGGRPVPVGRFTITDGRAILALGSGVFRIVVEPPPGAPAAEAKLALRLGETKPVEIALSIPAPRPIAPPVVTPPVVTPPVVTPPVVTPPVVTPPVVTPPVVTPPPERLVRIEVVLPAPTLLDAGVRPDVRIEGPGGLRHALAAGRTDLRLAPGAYTGVVQSATGERRLPLLVEAGTGELTLRIEAAPGWIEAVAATPGIFVLYDAAGTALGQFRRTDRVFQSLPEGSYRIGFTGPSDQETVEDFTIVLGQGARIVFP